ncbi:MAG: hypothetical protein ACJ797_05135 [Ktedonobacteraceae bacterium]
MFKDEQLQTDKGKILLKLFEDDIVRTDEFSQKQRKSFYVAINESPRSDYEAARQLLGTWFRDYTSDLEQNPKSTLRERFCADENDNHLGAFFELYSHALLKKQGFLVYPEYIADQNVGRPIDFLVQPPDFLPFYLEAAVAMDPEDVESEERLEELRQSLSKINDPNFLLDFKWERKSKAQLPTALIREDLQKLLQKLGKDSTREEKLELASYDLNGWKLFFFAIPRSRQGKMKQPIMGQPLSAQWVPYKNFLRKTLEGKGEKGRYGNLEYPFIIAVNILAQDSLGCDLDELFFGKEVYLFDTLSGEGTITRSTSLNRPYSENGFWRVRRRWREDREHVSAVLLVDNLWPLSIAHQTPILWHNPSAAKPLNPGIWHGPQMIFDLNTSLWNLREGKSAWEILRLPQAWPNTDTPYLAN